MLHWFSWKWKENATLDTTPAQSAIKKAIRKRKGYRTLYIDNTEYVLTGSSLMTPTQQVVILWWRCCTCRENNFFLLHTSINTCFVAYNNIKTTLTNRFQQHDPTNRTTDRDVNSRINWLPRIFRKYSEMELSRCYAQWIHRNPINKYWYLAVKLETKLRSR